MNKSYVFFAIIFSFFILLKASAINPTLDIQPIVEGGHPGLVIKNMSNKKVILPDDLRGVSLLGILISNNAKLIPDKRWIYKPVNNEYGGGMTALCLEPSEVKKTGLILDIFSTKLTGKYFMWYIVRNAPDNCDQIIFSSPITFEVKNNWSSKAKKITRDEIPKKVYDRFLEEIDKIKHEPPVSRP